MKKLFYILILSTLTLFFPQKLSPQNSELTQDYGKVMMYHDFGDFYYEGTSEGTYTKFNVFVTREINYLVQKNGYKYKYVLKIKSLSKIDNELANTYIEITNVDVKIDGILKSTSTTEFPDGFWIIAENKPTDVYYFQCDSPNVNFTMNWRSSIYYPKTINSFK